MNQGSVDQSRKLLADARTFHSSNFFMTME